MTWTLIVTLIGMSWYGIGVGMTHIDGFSSKESCEKAAAQYRKIEGNDYHYAICVEKS